MANPAVVSELNQFEIEQYRVAFNEFDTDNDGSISVRELRRAFKDMGVKKKDKELQGKYYYACYVH